MRCSDSPQRLDRRGQDCGDTFYKLVWDRLQEMLYQHLPEPMRNKETFDWMLSNPEYRKQLAQTLKAQASPEA